MRIVHVLKHVRPGNGGVHVAVDLACEQAQQGHQVWVASALGTYSPLLTSHGVRIIELPELDSILHAVHASIRFSLACLRIRPDIIHAHMMSSVIFGRLAAYLTRARLVATVHNSFDAHSWLMRLANRVVAVSDAERRQLEDRGFSRKNLRVVLNGTRGSARETIPLQDIGPVHQPSIITLSGIHPRKGVAQVIDAFALLHERYPGWHLNVVGWGPQLEALIERVKTLGLISHVHFLGVTQTPSYLLQTSDILATAPSADPCPLNVIEARIAGCAVVATAVGGIPELLEHGRAGVLTASRAPEDIAAALGPLMGSASELKKWRQASQMGVDYYSVQRVARDYFNIYSD